MSTRTGTKNSIALVGGGQAGSGRPPEAASISISLVSHTNVGKTTLARTLLGRDIGEVRDEAHVTEAAEAHVLVQAPSGEQLLLWDTPGFGDSLRLARRMSNAGNALGWLLTEVWDRWRDRPFWASQLAIRHVLGQADIVLYLVNASEAPEDAAYLAPELQVLALLKKPVLVLLNQTGPVGQPEVATPSADPSATQPANLATEQHATPLSSLVARWQSHLAAHAVVHGVLPLDAFTRCWVQEAVLWQAVLTQLPDDRQAVFARLQAAWQDGQTQRWQQAMAELARRLGRAALDREAVPDAGWRGRLGALGQVLGHALGRPSGQASATERAMAALAQRLDADVRQSTDQLILLHGLDGHAGREVLSRLAKHYAVRQPLDEGRAALWGGLVTGALAGLKADIASGGLTLGGGLLAGGVLGALGAAGAVRGVNRIRGSVQSEVAWDAKVLDALLANALLGYLAVAHHGRGRGAWVATDPPAGWTDAVDQVLASQRAEIDGLWQQRQVLLAEPLAEPLGELAPGAGYAPAASQALAPTPMPADPAVAAWQLALDKLIRGASKALLARLYPQAGLP